MRDPRTDPQTGDCLTDGAMLICIHRVTKDWIYYGKGSGKELHMLCRVDPAAYRRGANTPGILAVPDQSWWEDGP